MPPLTAPRVAYWGVSALGGGVACLVLDHLHVTYGVLFYPAPDFAQQAWWVFPLFVSATIGALLLAGRFFPANPRSVPASHGLARAGRDLAIFALAYATSAVLSSRAPAVVVLAALLGLFVLNAARRMTRSYVLFCALVMVAGTGWEMMWSGIGMFTYLHPDLLGVPVWLPLLYAHAAVAAESGCRTRPEDEGYPESRRASLHEPWLHFLPMAIPLFLAVFVFARCVSFPFVNWDDGAHFVDNPLVIHPLERGWRELFQTKELGSPLPATILVYAADRVLWGLWPAPYHMENLLFHLANVAMLFRFARRVGLSPKEASAAATLFAIHPLVVEPVCWATGRKDVVSTAMVLGAALLAAGSEKRKEMSALWRWVLADVLLVLAVLAQPRAVVGPLLVFFLVRGARPGWPFRSLALRLAGALAIVIPLIVIAAREVTAMGAVPPPRPLVGIVLDVAAAWSLQLSHLLLPVDLLAYYFRVPGDPPLWAILAAALATALALAFVATRTDRGSPIRTGTILSLIAYAPVSGVFLIRRWTADSYMYVPLAMMSLALVPAVTRAWPTALARFGGYAASALGAILALLSLVGTSRWSSSTNVWAGSIARYPMEPLSYEHEALGLVADGRNAEANPIFIELAERFPDWADTLDDEVRAYEASGNQGRAAEVLEHGVRLGNLACVRMYWWRLIASPTLPAPGDWERDLIAVAFRNGYSSMKQGLHDVAAFRRVVLILRAVGLDDQAADAEAHVGDLERAPSYAMPSAPR